MTPDEAELVERYRDGVLDTPERAALDARLLADPEFSRAFVAEMRMGGQIAAVASVGRARAQLRGTRGATAAAAAAAAAAPARPGARLARRRPRPRRSPMVWGACAASVAACLVAAVMLVPRARADGATLTTLTQGVELLHDGRTGSALAGEAVRPGDQLRVPVGGSAELRFADGSDVQLAAGTLASVVGGSRRGIELTQGALTADVAKQAPGTSMAFSTVAAQALVIGTRLELAIVAGATRLRVDEGRVAFAPRSGDSVAAGLLVVAGQTAVVTGGSATLVAAPAAATPAVVQAPSDDDRRTAALARVIAPSDDELAWLALGWDTDLWHARRRAQAEGKPLLVWAGWGDPLGMASRECLDDRRVLWSDAQVQALVRSRFVLVAVDAWFLNRRQDGVGRFFAQLVAQQLAQSKRPSDLNEGIYCCSASGTLLAMVPCGSDRARAWDAFNQALDAQAAPSAPIAEPGQSEPALAPHPPAGALVAVAEARRLRSAAGGGEAASARGAPGREALWLPAEAWRALLPQTLAVGQRSAVPAAVIGLIARNALLDTTHGECAVWERSEVVSAQLSSEVVAVEPALVRLRLIGSVSLAGGGRAYAPTLVGSLDYSPDQRRIRRLELVALGAWRRADGARPSDEQLGIVIHLADPQAPAVHPHGARSPGGLLP